MCGIAGVFFPSGRPVETPMLDRMGASMHHRGPDDTGQFTAQGLGFVHKRLSIIDLSSGHQPMLSEDGQSAIVFNGEIYNYLELRQRLLSQGIQFRTQSDTEVLLQLYLREGEKCLESLNGMFAFAIWDARSRRLFAARDRVGIKPFYYYWDGKTFAFASEIKTLFASGLVTPEMNPEGLEDYMSFQFCLGKRTLFKNVNKLEPGQRLVLEGTNLNLRQYWSVNDFAEGTMGEKEATSKLLRLLEDSVRLQLRSDVPVGTYLSGGVDSSAVTIMAADLLGMPIHTFTGVFEGKNYDESAFARMASAKGKTAHHEVYPNAAQMGEVLPKLVYHMDEPAAGPGLFPQYIVAQEARKHVKVVLTGHGGDEMFGGYARYMVAYLEQAIKGAIFETQEEGKHLVMLSSLIPNLSLLRQYTPMIKDFWKDGVFDSMDKRYYRLIDRGRDLRDLLLPEAYATSTGRVQQEFSDMFNRNLSVSYFNRMTFFDLQTLLPALLHVEDRVSMSVSLESRVPLLDHRIVEYVIAVPPLLKFAGGRTKSILKSALEGVVPNEILYRKEKMGFPFPYNQWFQTDLKDFIHDTLGGKSLRERGWFDSKRVDALLSGEGSYDRGVWGLLNLELWAKAFFDEHRYDVAHPA
jgi:asparagine synthase (glutamine-hydrolysing)